MTLLEAVNTILSVQGEPPVFTVEHGSEAPPPQVAIALNLLAEVRREVLLRGWHFNTDHELEMARNTDGEILVPATALKIDASEVEGVDVSVREGKLYDKDRKSFTFDRNLRCDVTWDFAFDTLPAPAQSYITVVAARRCQARYVGSTTLDGFTETDEVRALVALQEAEGEDRDASIFDHWTVARSLRRAP